METVVRRMAIQLSEAQLNVLESVFRHRCVIITGGPGTGKTTLIRAIAAIFEAVGRSCLLAAPTGRAARRMAEVTGRTAATLHKLLGYNLAEGCFERDQDDPLDTQALIVDEASMVDAVLMAHLIQALPLQASLILVGDVFQLPSVGPGNVLGDLIDSGAVRTFMLEDIFRQAASSPIVVNAHRVRHGELPELSTLPPGEQLQPFTFIESGSLEEISRTIIELCVHRIPGQLGLDAVRQVQVLTPMHKSAVGTLQLNSDLQSALNPEAAAGSCLAGRFHVRDKVMHLRNNYRKEVFNGEIGTVSAVDPTEKRLVVDYEGRQVSYEESDLDELTLAYAISVHKSQGSEYPVVILPVVTQHYVMLQRNLLYTALTRARDMVILIGSPKAVRIAVQSDQPRRRLSWLAWRLCHPVET
jgi:exodeoxyribonuclease V alpha subunit